MAKSNKTIHNSVRIGKTVYGPGMEDELQSFLSEGDVNRLTDQGAISGFKAGAAASVDESADDENSDAEEGKDAPPKADDSKSAKTDDDKSAKTSDKK